MTWIVPAALRTWVRRVRAPVVPCHLATAGRWMHVQGTIMAPPELVVAPFSGIPCVCFWAALDHQQWTTQTDSRGNQRDVRGFVRQFSDRGAVPFSITDDQRTRVRVEQDWLDLQVDGSDQASSPRLQSADVAPELDAYLRRQGVSPSGFMGVDGDHRFLEVRLQPGDAVTVYGLVHEKHERVSGAYRDGVESVLSIGGLAEAHAQLTRRDRGVP